MVDPHKFQPLRDGVVVRDFEVVTKTQSGLILALENPDCVDAISGTTDGSHGNYARISLEGVVVACGPGKRNEKGILRPMQLKPGDRVRYTAWNDAENFFEKPFRLITEGDVWWKHENSKEKAKAARAGA